MKSMVIDANVFAAYAIENITGIKNANQTASPTPIFESLGKSVVAFIDDGGKIQREWENLATFAQEWFNEWLADSLANGQIYEISPSSDPHLSRRYKQLGFPATADIWYIKTAHGLCILCQRGTPTIVSEDIDFYDPKKKNAANKINIFLKGQGEVLKQLKKDGIDVKCIQNAIQLI